MKEEIDACLGHDNRSTKRQLKRDFNNMSN